MSSNVNECKPLDLGRYTMDRGNSKGKDGEVTAPSFFRLVLELTRVETAVLLHDMTRDDAELRAKVWLVYTSPSPRDRTRSRMSASD